MHPMHPCGYWNDVTPIPVPVGHSVGTTEGWDIERKHCSQNRRARNKHTPFHLIDFKIQIYFIGRRESAITDSDITESGITNQL